MNKWQPLGLFLAGLGVSALLGYMRADKAMSERVTALETVQPSVERRLDNIERKVDQLLERVVAR